MHVPNHLISPEAAILGGVVAVALIAVAFAKVKRTEKSEKLPLVGVMGAFVFAAQMLNFSFGAVGFSGHLIGGVLLAAILGKWLGFLTLSGVLILQSLLFADGGVMALGWNIVNMAVIGALVVYPLLFEPIVKRSTSAGRVFIAALCSSIVAVVLGSLCVVAEAALSGTMVQVGGFLGFMLPAHIAIGLGEGLITGIILALIAQREPSILDCNKLSAKALCTNIKGVIGAFALAALIIGGGLSLVASERPDGLEWSMEKSLQQDRMVVVEEIHKSADALQESIAIAPDYAGNYTGLLATAGILLLAWVGSGTKRKKTAKQHPLH